MLSNRVRSVCIGDMRIHAWVITGNLNVNENQRIRIFKEASVPYTFYEVEDCRLVEDMCKIICYDAIILAPRPENYRISEASLGTNEYNRQYNDFLEHFLDEYENARRKLEEIGRFPPKSIFLERSHLNEERMAMVEKHNFNCIISQGNNQLLLLDTALSMLR